MNKRTFKGSKAFRQAQCDGTLSPGKAYNVMVLHDEGCSPSRCACDPDYVVEDLTVETYKRGVEATRKWIKDTAS